MAKQSFGSLLAEKASTCVTLKQVIRFNVDQDTRPGNQLVAITTTISISRDYEVVIRRNDGGAVNSGWY